MQPTIKLFGVLRQREKVDAKCLLAEMTLVMMSLPLVCAFMCFSMLVYLCAHFCSALTCKLSFLFLPCCQSALERLLAGYFKCSWEKCIIPMAFKHKNFTYMQNQGGKSSVFCSNSKNNSQWKQIPGSKSVLMLWC